MKADSVRPLLFEAREQRLAALDALSRSLWLGGMTNAQVVLEPRLQALLMLRDGLVAGRLPPADEWTWPPPALAGALATTMAQLDLAGYCAKQTDLAATVLMSILVHIDFIVD